MNSGRTYTPCLSFPEKCGCGSSSNVCIGDSRALANMHPRRMTNVPKRRRGATCVSISGSLGWRHSIPGRRSDIHGNDCCERFPYCYGRIAKRLMIDPIQFCASSYVAQAEANRRGGSMPMSVSGEATDRWRVVGCHKCNCVWPKDLFCVT